jgi:hypothetical protein
MLLSRVIVASVIVPTFANGNVALNKFFSRLIIRFEDIRHFKTFSNPAFLFFLPPFGIILIAVVSFLLFNVNDWNVSDDCPGF